MRAGTTTAGVGAVFVIFGCGPGPESTPEAGGELASTLEVQVERDAVRLELRVTNPTAAPVILEYPTSQRYDFAVLRPDGGEVWRWSAERMFAQVLGTETLGPGETVEYGAGWDAAGAVGRYVAVAELTASNVRVERRKEFEVR